MKTNHLQLAALLLGLAAVGCNRAPQQALKDVKVPAGFTFATSHAVDVKVSAPRSGTLNIARADGRVVFRGKVTAAQPVRVSLSVPLKDSELTATLIGSDGVASNVKLPISGSSATYAF